VYDWRATLLKPTDTLEDAIQSLDRASLRIVMVADNQTKLLGTITDGDIRRALIKHQSLSMKVEQVMFKYPTTATLADGNAKILALMKKKNLLQIPILDEKGGILGLKTLQNAIELTKFENPVFLMAGGFGKRLRPLTNDTPKPLLKVGNKPILEIILEQLVEYGFQTFYISTHYKSDMVCRYFGNGSKWGVKIKYLCEEKPLGTAGALGLLPDNIPNLPILVMNSDLLTKINYKSLIEFHNDQNGVATMCSREYDFQVPYGVIKIDGQKIIKIIEKPAQKYFINAGIYVLDPILIKEVSGNSYLDMPTFLESQIQKGQQISMFPIHEYWLDIGQMEEYELAHKIYYEKFS